MKFVIAALAVVVGLVLIFVGPVFTITALNTLFGLNIAYTVGTWFAVFWLNLTTFGGLAYTIRSLKS